MSPEGRGAQLRSKQSQFYNLEINGYSYRVFYAKTARWEVRLAAPKFSTLVLLNMVIPEMTLQMLIALPIMAVIIWLVVARGLLPLRQLSDLIAHKDKDDLTPLNFGSPYAELKPLSAALDRLLNQLRSKIEREHAFVQDAAHELRTR
ncbi:hypothetical protein HZU75_08425 [Chitinibacter fontanus]|uniref:histidine kinase n=1 Tax=Chitinibacter fontanus TaxID=1737446 RepID=A0A7D5VA51_9NEIS|nr:hypothetical protein [Chitinibacter fontanus]QLI81552.1 hypothetical protein HZU75_08425 [Chitinibacter fontanus]